MQESIKNAILAAMNRERTEFNHGYLLALVELYRANFSDTPKWLIEAANWYK